MTKFDPAIWPQSVCGEYRIKMLLGTGRESAVYIGEHISTKALVAVKIYQPGSLAEAAKAAAKDRARLNHPNIVPQLSSGVAREEFFFTVQEFATYKKVGTGTAGDCCNLEEYLTHSQGLLPEDLVSDFLIQLLDALSYVHTTTALPYGGLNPHGIVVSESESYGGRPRLRLTDVGLPAIRTAESADDVYISPEEIQGQPTVQSDIYALGAIAHLLLTGAPPVDQQFAPQMVRSDVSKGWEVLIKRAMSFQPKERFESYQDFSHAITHIDDLPPVKPEPQPQRFWFYLSCLICFLLLLGFAFRDQLRDKIPGFDRVFPSDLIKPVEPPKPVEKDKEIKKPENVTPSSGSGFEIPRVVTEKKDDVLAPSGTDLNGNQTPANAVKEAAAAATNALANAAGELKDVSEKGKDAVEKTEEKVKDLANSSAEKAEALKAEIEKKAEEAKAAAEKKAEEAKAAAEKKAEEAKAAAEKKAAEAKAAAEKALKETTEKTENPTEYIVKKGDTLWGIARKEGVKVKDLLELNGLEEDALIKEGMKLKLKGEAAPSAPAAAATAASAATETKTYTVQKGDTYFNLARSLEVPVKDLQELNENKELRAGDTIKVPEKK